MNNKKRGIIYILKNKINNKCYVGQTVNKFYKRWNSHCSKLKNFIINNAIRKYGKNNFIKYIYYDIPILLLDYFEKDLIKNLNTLVPNGYNLQNGGNKNKTHHKITIEKLRKSHLGKKLTEETKKKISLKNKGKIISNKTKLKISIANSGKNNGMYGRVGKNNPKWGKKLSKEIRDKISKRLTGRKIKLNNNQLIKMKERMIGDNNPMKKNKNKEKVSKKLKGRKLTEEHKNKLRLAKLGKKRKPHSEETKKKISIALRKENE
jgi:group I intron endonuclease